MRKPSKTRIPITRIQFYVMGFYVVCLLLSNIISNRQSTIFGINITAGVIVYPLVFILSDVISEVWGYKWSRKACYAAFACNIFFAIIGYFVCTLPYPNWFTGAESYNFVLKCVPRITAASLASFVIGGWVNDLVFKVMKRGKTDTSKGYGWRAIVSSLFGEIVDSGIFIPCAFIGTMPTNEILTMVFVQVTFKVCYEIVVLPLNTYIMNKIKKSHTDELQSISPKLVADYIKEFE